MTLLADIKASLRITSDAFDAEVETLIGAAIYDMGRTGVNPALLEMNNDVLTSGNAFVKQAITAYCKAHFGYDNAEAGRFDDSYRRIVCDLLNSAENIAAMEEEPEAGGEPETEPDAEPTTEPEPTPEPDAGEGE